MNKTSIEYGYLALADISGYNAFVAGTEFDHAQEIIHDLLEFLVEKLRPLLTLVQVEGDAVFAYSREDRILRGETIFELIESTYAAFKDRLTSIKRHHSCTCAACQNVNILDLKFFFHYGAYIEHSIDDHHGLLGYAPMFVRERTWKEPIAASRSDWHGYALFTADSLAKLLLSPEDLEAVEFLGTPLKTFGLNLKNRYEAFRESRQVVVTPIEADASLRSELDAPPLVTWEWLNDPQKRNLWWESFTRWTARLRPGGRTGPGAVNHCNHGIGDMLETILDWRPFEYFTVNMLITPGHFEVLQTTALEALPGGKTALKVYYRLQNHHPRWAARPVCWMVAGFMRWELRRLQQQLRQ